MAAKKIKLVVTSGIAIGGEIVPPGSEITVDEPLARNLLHRNKAKLFTEAEAEAAAVDDDDLDKPLDELKVPQLKAVAASLEIEGAANMKRDELIAAIGEAEGAGE